jgi:hypothetical protein
MRADLGTIRVTYNGQLCPPLLKEVLKDGAS